MGTVISFPATKRPPQNFKEGRVLACLCGNMSFMAHEGGPLQCAECGGFVQNRIVRRIEPEGTVS